MRSEVASRQRSTRPRAAGRAGRYVRSKENCAEPALRAIWLVICERAEPVLTEVIAERLGRCPHELPVRVQAATLNAALRITTEELAAAAGDPGPSFADEGCARLSEAVRAATRGVLGDALTGGHPPVARAR